MQINIHARNFILTDAIRTYITRRLAYALSSRDEHIQRINVRLSDINGPRGGADKRFQIQVVLDQLSDVVIEDTEVDLYVAIDRAVDRASRTVDRKLNRHRYRSRVVRRKHIALSVEGYDSHELSHAG
ncbi:MAG: ribosomal subunit interface protein [Pseudohongiellaceae bacterium]|jgi:ribosomal subunit interface protein